MSGQEMALVSMVSVIQIGILVTTSTICKKNDFHIESLIIPLRVVQQIIASPPTSQTMYV